MDLANVLPHIDKEIIEFIGYVDPIINKSVAGFKFCTLYLIFVFIDYKFYYLPWLFDVRFMFDQ